MEMKYLGIDWRVPVPRPARAPPDEQPRLPGLDGEPYAAPPLFLD